MTSIANSEFPWLTLSSLLYCYLSQIQRMAWLMAVIWMGEGNGSAWNEGWPLTDSQRFGPQWNVEIGPWAQAWLKTSGFEPYDTCVFVRRASWTVWAEESTNVLSKIGFEPMSWVFPIREKRLNCSAVHTQKLINGKTNITSITLSYYTAWNISRFLLVKSSHGVSLFPDAMPCIIHFLCNISHIYSSTALLLS